MNLYGRLRYRVGQALQVVWSPVGPDDVAEAEHWLPPAAVALWQRQSPRDQAHALRVLHTLQAAGYTHPDLMAAALLHDVGKVEAGLRLWHRTLWVLANALCPSLARWLTCRTGWRYPFWVLAEHPCLGARLAREVGCTEGTAWLIAHHQDYTPCGEVYLRKGGGEGHVAPEPPRQRPGLSGRPSGGEGENERLLAALRAADDAS